MGQRRVESVENADVSSSGEGVDVSVLIPTLNEEAYLEGTLVRLRSQDFDGAVEFLFVDGRSDDATWEILQRAAEADSRIRILDNPRRGIPFALNIGLWNARGEYVARMDAHTLYPPDYLARGVERLRRGDAEWVSGPQIPYGTDAWSRIVALALGTRLGIGGASFRDASEEIETDTGYTGLWRRETLLRHRGWDERWIVNEDSELAARVREEGGRILCIPEMGARYIPRNSLQSLARQYWRYGQYRARTCRAHPQSMRRSHVLPPALVLTLLAALLRRGRGSRLPRLGAGAYALALLATAASRGGEGVRTAAAVPAALVTMHLAWGLGFLAGCARFGPPMDALRSLARECRPASRR